MTQPKSPLDWEKFEQLSGSARTNFELLWRGAVHKNYAKYGQFTARTQQAGVEFHLRFETSCSLGEPGACFGWQTKYWDLAPSTAIGKTRREDIEDSIAKTKQYYSEVTDFVLVTRHPLTAGDQEWFEQRNVGLKLHMWSATELDEHLIGDALLLRESYFGELVLTDERLAKQHAIAVSEVRERWVPEAHQPPAGERHLRRMLAQSQAWTDLEDLGRDIEKYAKTVRDSIGDLDGRFQTDILTVVDTAELVAEIVNETHTRLVNGDAAALIGTAALTLPPLPQRRPEVLRRLRSLRHRAALAATNLVSYTRRGAEAAEWVGKYLTMQLAVVTGDAGYGKTQLAATLTAPGGADGTDGNPGGVLLLARYLERRGSLDDLAKQFSVSGKPLASFEELLAAVDAAAARAGRRLPIVIDGLNESEAPVEWHSLLPKVLAQLDEYPHVLVVCTVRETHYDECIPDGHDIVVVLDGFNTDLTEVMAKYFAHYKIEPGDTELPRELLAHPLTLRLFCDVANPERRKPVTAERLPASLTGLFDAYTKQTARRIHTTTSGRFAPADVTDALTTLGAELWETNDRDIPVTRADDLFGDIGRRWNEKLRPVLESEGVIIRNTRGGGAETIAVVYDMLAGHVIAKSLIAQHGASIATLLAEPAVQDKLGGSFTDQHPLAGDILEGLAGGMPKASAGQLWKVVGPQLRHRALLLAAKLEATYLDTTTIETLADEIGALKGNIDLFDHLKTVRSTPGHPLNAEYLDRILRGMNVSERDLRWTEWLRRGADKHCADAAELTARWKTSTHRTATDALRARWLMWLLTSVDRTLRDAATAALYWYGRHDPAGLFALSVGSASINDAYVPERMLAACYGVVTAHQLQDAEFEPILATLCEQLVELYIDPRATTPTSHALMRSYTSGIFEFTRRFYPQAVPAQVATSATFTTGTVGTPAPKGDPRRDEVRGTIRMDFGNYTLGRLFDDRNNYDDGHPGHQAAKDTIYGIIHDLGWREATFGEIDRRIAEPRRFRTDAGKFDRYGKKYSWIGFHTVAGELADGGAAPEWLERDIDPTFPQPPQQLNLDVQPWAATTPADEIAWLTSGVVAVPDELIRPQIVNGVDGPWLLIHAFLDARDIASGRRVFGLFNTVIVEQSDLGKLLNWIKTVGHAGRDLIDIPEAHYTFGGEIPWQEGFGHPEPGGRPEDVYRSWVGRGEEQVPFERIAHSFTSRSFDSSENSASGYVPSRLLSQALDLRGLPACLDQAQPGGTFASLSVEAPEGFTGGLLYHRADLIAAYAAGRAVVTFGWGERETQMAYPEELPDAVRQAYQANQNIWRQHWQR